MCQGIVPPYLLENVAERADGRAAQAAAASLSFDQTLRTSRTVRLAHAQTDQLGEPGLVPPSLRQHGGVRTGEPSVAAPTKKAATPAAKAKVARAVYDAQHGTTLPGRLRRAEGARKTADTAVNQAYSGLGDTWKLYWKAYQRNSLDNRGLRLVATVHYANNYDNAFWDGTQMVFGDGDGEIFGSFTGCIDVIGHELAHGVTQYSAGLVYLAQSGALNESVSDVFGSLVKQMTLKQTAAQADWLIGEGLFTPSVKGVALRSMKAPGTAYDDPRLGKDPQPADMDHYQDMPHDAQHDNGGVHINSGIPNHAFYLAATAIGGNAWDKAGLIWYDTLTTGGIPADCSFVQFAEATIAAATKRYGEGAETTAVRDAWTQVKVLK